MLDQISTTAAAEPTLDETKVTTELERLAADEIRLMRARIVKAERRATDAAIAAARKDGGSRYTPAELVATCRAALSLALKGTRGMRLTADDYADLSSDLVATAIERGQRRNIERGEAPSAMPRRDDLSDGRDVAWIAGAARRMLADLAERDSARSAVAPSEDAEDAAPLYSDLSTDDLCEIVGMDTPRVRLAIRHATEGVALVDLAAEIGKTAKGAERAAAKGREAIAASVTPREIREAAAKLRDAAPADAEPHPLERAAKLVKAREDAIRQGRVIERTWIVSGPLAATPEGIGRLIGRKVRSAALRDLSRTVRRVDPMEPTPRGTIDTTGAEIIGRPMYRPGEMNWTHTPEPRTVQGAIGAPLPPHRAWGPMTADVTADLSARRLADLTARQEARAALWAASKVTTLEPAARPADYHLTTR